jgi:hypothetical protein
MTVFLLVKETSFLCYLSEGNHHEVSSHLAFLTSEEDKPSQASVSHQKSFDLRKQAESKEYLTNRYLNSTEASFAYSI